MFSGIGNLGSYLKNVELQRKWQKKQQDGEFGPAASQGKQTQKSLFEVPQPDYSLDFINSKIRSGKKLSPGELEYLRQKHPEVYKKAVQLNKEREEYERRLRQCRTKEEVRALNASKISGLAGEMKRTGDSGGSDLQDRITNIQSEHSRFTQGRRYKGLPVNEEERARRKKRGEREAPEPAGQVTIYLPAEEAYHNAARKQAGVPGAAGIEHRGKVKDLRG